LTRIISFANQKGGVGKTTTVFNLGFALASRKKRTLLIDIDPQANLTSWAGMSNADPSMTNVFVDKIPIDRVIVPGQTGEPDFAPVSGELAGIDVVYANEIGREQRLKKALSPVVGRYDFILIDCPPSLGLLTVNAMVASQEIFIPIQTKVMALSGIVSLIRTVGLIRESYNTDIEITGIIACMFDQRTRLSREVVERLRQNPELGGKLFRTVIRENVRLAEAPSFEQSIFQNSPRSYGAEEYANLAREIIKQRS